MSRDYSLADMFLRLHDMQPPPPPPAPLYVPPPYQMMHNAPNASATPPFELTPCAGAVAAADAGAGPGGAEGARGGGGSAPAQPEPPPLHQEHRKRKSHHFASGSTCDEDTGDDAHSTRSVPDKKQNHSEIEKRRRDKMNTYITELSSMVPMCGAMARKLDKLTVLRMAVQHLRLIRGALSACPLTARPRPELLSERELNAIVLRAAHDCFLLVVGCDRGRLLYVSNSVTSMLHYDQSELVGQSLFDLLHPKDVAKVKEQFSASDFGPRERLIDAITMLPVKTELVTAASRFCPGARRSFFCRIKCRDPPASAHAPPAPVKEESLGKARKSERKYCVVQCTGYLKSWAPTEMSEGGGEVEAGDDGDAGNVSCLVAVARALSDIAPPPAPTAPEPPPPQAAAPAAAALPRLTTRPLQFVSRHATDGKFLFVDQRVTQVLGFLPQELIGTSLYEYVSGPELGAVARAHKQTLQQDAPHRTPTYKFRTKDYTHTAVVTHFKPFRNPWTKDVECLVANHTLVQDNYSGPEDNAAYQEIFKNEPDVEMQRLIESHVESHKIGTAMAEVTASSVYSPPLPLPLPLPPDLMQDIDFTQQPLTVDSIMAELPMFCELRPNVPLSCATECSALAGAGGDGAEAANSPPPPASPPLPPLGTDSNGEATMAVIMSLLEADGEFGAPASFSGLPWPLP